MTQEDGVRTPKIFSKITLSKSLSTFNAPREMVVVCMGKSTQMQSDERFKQNIDSLEEYFKELGYKRIIFQLARGFGRPIYREIKNY